MKFANMSVHWQFSESPLRGFHCTLGFGNTMQEHGFLPVTAPVVQRDGRFVLENGTFTVHKRRGMHAVVESGPDVSGRMLLLAGASGGYHGSVRLSQDTTGEVIEAVHAGDALQSRAEVAALLKPGQRVAFESWGRFHHDVLAYIYDGQGVRLDVYSRKEWDAFVASAEAPTDKNGADGAPADVAVPVPFTAAV